MSRARGVTARLALVVAAAVVASTGMRAQAPPSAGIVKTVAGAATIVHAGQEHSAAVGGALAEGDLVRTGAGGRVGITLKDGTRLSLGSRTEVRLGTFAYAPAEGRLGLALTMLRGVLEYVSGRIAHLSPGSVRVETPTSVIGVRGTHLVIEVGQP